MGWEGVGASGAENRKSTPHVDEGSAPVRIIRRKNKKGEEWEDKRNLLLSAGITSSIWLSSLGFASEEGDAGLFPLILALMSSGVSINGPYVCLGDGEPDPSSDTSSLGKASTGGRYAL